MNRSLEPLTRAARILVIDRSGGIIELPVRTEALVDLKIDSYDSSECPLSLVPCPFVPLPRFGIRPSEVRGTRDKGQRTKDKA